MVRFRFGQTDKGNDLNDPYSATSGNSDMLDDGIPGSEELIMEEGDRINASDAGHTLDVRSSAKSQRSNSSEADIEDSYDDPPSQRSTLSNRHLESERPCTLVIRPSALSHSAYISRQAYYGPYSLEESTAPGSMLLGAVPRGMRGLYNFDIRKGEEPISVRKRRNAKREEETNAKGWTTLQELWEKGKREREQT